MSILSHAIPGDNMGRDGTGRKIYKIIPSHGTKKFLEVSHPMVGRKIF
jgi:hypothetical protein